MTASNTDYKFAWLYLLTASSLSWKYELLLVSRRDSHSALLYIEELSLLLLLLVVHCTHDKWFMKSLTSTSSSSD